MRNETRSRAGRRTDGSYSVAYLELVLFSTSTQGGGDKERTLRNAV